MKKLIKALVAISAISILHNVPATACTDFRLTAKDGTLLITRSMEFGIDLNSHFHTSTVNRVYATIAPDGKSGLTWKAKYGYVYLDGFGQDIALDGMNTVGLTFEYLYLPGETTYQTVPNGKSSQALAYDMFGDWVLSNFKTIDEVKQALANIYVFPRTLPGLGSMILQAHASIYDASGKGIVVEFINGQINVYDNVGIMTNSPQYNWHLSNLNNYLNLTPNSPNPVVAGGIVYSSNGQGAGSIGLPGDSSPSSRFVKTSFMAHNAYPANNISDALNLAQHIINNVDIPAGVSRSTVSGQVATDTTEWVVFKDVTHKVVYYRTYNDMTIRAIDMNKLNFAEDAPRLNMALVETPYIMDATSKFMSALPAKAPATPITPTSK
jgi:choloylglycine hydrolase